MSDELERALRALREEETGKSPQAEATLEKILVQRRGQRGAWARRARTWLPIAAALAIAGSALARSGGTAWLRAQLRGSDESSETDVRSGGPGRKAGEAPAPSAVEAASAAPVEASSGAATDPRVPPTAPTAPAAPAAIEATPKIAPSSPHVRVASSAPAVAPVPSSPSPPASPAADTPPASSGAPAEADVYARAHRLHFDGGNPRAALSAWDDYLARYPAGRFAPDARYNRAIDLLELKRIDEARAALQPFADGAFGGYHRDDARTLLKSIH